jgi:hypothetical protein
LLMGRGDRSNASDRHCLGYTREREKDSWLPSPLLYEYRCKVENAAISGYTAGTHGVRARLRPQPEETQIDPLAW